MQSENLGAFYGAVRFSRRRLTFGNRSILVQNLVDYDLQKETKQETISYDYGDSVPLLAIGGTVLSVVACWWTSFGIPALVGCGSLAFLATKDRQRTPTTFESWSIVLLTARYQLCFKSTDRKGVKDLYEKLSTVIDSGSDARSFEFNVSENKVVNVTEDKSRKDTTVNISNASGVQIGDGNLQANTGDTIFLDTVRQIKEAVEMPNSGGLSLEDREGLRQVLEDLQRKGVQSKGIKERLHRMLGRVRDGAGETLPVVTLLEKLLTMLN